MTNTVNADALSIKYRPRQRAHSRIVQVRLHVMGAARRCSPDPHFADTPDRILTLAHGARPYSRSSKSRRSRESALVRHRLSAPIAAWTTSSNMRGPTSTRCLPAGGATRPSLKTLAPLTTASVRLKRARIGLWIGLHKIRSYFGLTLTLPFGICRFSRRVRRICGRFRLSSPPAFVTHRFALHWLPGCAGDNRNRPRQPENSAQDRLSPA